MKATLINLDNHLILINDEEPKEGDTYLLNNNIGCIIEIKQNSVKTKWKDLSFSWGNNISTDHIINLSNAKKVIAQSPNIILFKEMDWVKKGVGMQGLAITLGKEYINKNFTYDDISEELNCYKHLETYIEGFTKSQSLKNPQFTLEDMRNCWNYAGDFFDEHTSEGTLKMNFDKFIQSLKPKTEQPKQWEVEVVEKKGNYHVIVIKIC